MPAMKHSLFALCVLCTLCTLVLCDMQCSEGCEVHYSGRLSHSVVASRQVKTKYILVKYKCSKGWWQHRYKKIRTCSRYRQVSYIDTKYRTVYCKSVGMRCKRGCGAP